MHYIWGLILNAIKSSSKQKDGILMPATAIVILAKQRANCGPVSVGHRARARALQDGGVIEWILMTFVFFGLWPVGSTRRLLTADGNGKTFADVLLLLRSCVVNELQPCLLLPHNLLRRSFHHPLVPEDGGKTIRFHWPLNPAFFEIKKRRSQDDPHGLMLSVPVPQALVVSSSQNCASIHHPPYTSDRCAIPWIHQMIRS
jgi:hypothetical protein